MTPKSTYFFIAYSWVSIFDISGVIIRGETFICSACFKTIFHGVKGKYTNVFSVICANPSLPSMTCIFNDCKNRMSVWVKAGS